MAAHKAAPKAARGRRRRWLWWGVGLVGAVVVLSLVPPFSYHLNTIERITLGIDWLSCSPIGDPVFPAFAPVDNARCDHADLGRAARLALGGDGVPSVYIAELDVNGGADAQGGPKGCRELELYDLLRANATGNLVTSAAVADWIIVPFYATCFPKMADGSHVEVHLKELVAELRAKGLYGRDNLFLYSVRPWAERTSLGADLYELLRHHPFVIASPELKNVKRSQIAPGNAAWLGKHIVVQQPALVFPALSHAGSGHRHFRFCFAGTQINSQRTVLGRTLARRGDSFIFAPCRRTRKQFQAAAMQDATQMYAHCDFCPMPMGDSLSDRRFFDALSVGCVPLVLMALKPLPFADRIDYRKGVVFLDQRLSDIPGALGEVADLPVPELEALRENALHIARRLSFGACSGHSGLYELYHQLNAVRRQRARVPHDIRGVLGLRGEL